MKQAVTGEVRGIRLIVDTNVATELYSVHDLVFAVDRADTIADALLSEDMVYRAARIRDTAMFAWFCHLHKAEVRGLANEILDTLLRRVPSNADPSPDEARLLRVRPAAAPTEPPGLTTAFVQAILYFVGDRVIPDWSVRKYDDEPESLAGDKADDWLLAKAVADGVPLITNEGNARSGLSDVNKKGKLNLRGKARKFGVPVYTPGEYLRLQQFDYGANARAFVDTFQEKRPGYLEGREDGRAADEVLSNLLGVYRLALFDQIDEKYRHLPRASWPP